MTSVQQSVSANVMTELYFQMLRRLGLLEPLRRVPFDIQRRRNGFAPSQRCLAFLATQAQGCEYLTDWKLPLRTDSRLCHWMGDRPAPHASTLSRSLAATDAQTVKILRRDVLVPLSDQAFLSAEATGRTLFLDIDRKGIPAEGPTYEGTPYGRMPDGRLRRGYGLHLLSLDNHWPLEMLLTGAAEHGVNQAMVLIKRLIHRLSGGARHRVVVRADANYGSVRFVRWLQRYPCGYLLKGCNAYTAKKLWRAHNGPRRRIERADRPDLLALDCGVTTLTGMTREKRADGSQRRRSKKITVPRVVVYQEDPAQVAPGQRPECFFLITTLPKQQYDCRDLLQAYLDRAGQVENVFSQLQQAFSITHLRCRSFHGNFTYLLFVMIAANLTQRIRDEALAQQMPVPVRLSEMLVAASESGLQLRQDEEAGCVLHEAADVAGPHRETFKALLRCSYQRCFRYAA